MALHYLGNWNFHIDTLDVERDTTHMVTHICALHMWEQVPLHKKMCKMSLLLHLFIQQSARKPLLHTQHINLST